MNKYITTLLILIVVVIVAGIGVVVLYDKPTEPGQPNGQINPPDSIPDEIDTSDWVEYVFEKEKVSIELPPNWIVGSGTVGPGFLGDFGIYPDSPLIYPDDYYPAPGIEKPIFAISFDRHDNGKIPFYDKSQDEVLLNDGEKIIIKNTQEDVGQIIYKNALGENFNNIYRSADIIGFTEYRDKYDVEGILKTITFSIKFLESEDMTSDIDTSDWQTYRNTKYEFSFKLPEDWKVDYEYGPKDVQIVNEINILKPGERGIFKPVAIVYTLDKENFNNINEYIEHILGDYKYTVVDVLGNGGFIFNLQSNGERPPMYKTYSLDSEKSGSLSTSGQFSFLYDANDYYIAIFGVESETLKEVAGTVEYRESNEVGAIISNNRFVKGDTELYYISDEQYGNLIDVYISKNGQEKKIIDDVLALNNTPRFSETSRNDVVVLISSEADAGWSLERYDFINIENSDFVTIQLRNSPSLIISQNDDFINTIGILISGKCEFDEKGTSNLEISLLDLTFNGEQTNILKEKQILNCTNEGDFDPYSPLPQFKFDGISRDLSKIYFTFTGFDLASRINDWEENLVYDVKNNGISYKEPTDLLEFKKIEN